jgi:hypothetical protein
MLEILLIWPLLECKMMFLYLKIKEEITDMFLMLSIELLKKKDYSPFGEDLYLLFAELCL